MNVGCVLCVSVCCVLVASEQYMCVYERVWYMSLRAWITVGRRE